MTEFKLKTASELSADEQANLLAGESSMGCSCGSCTATCTCNCSDSHPSSSISKESSKITKDLANSARYTRADANK